MRVFGTPCSDLDLSDYTLPTSLFISRIDIISDNSLILIKFFTYIILIT